MAFCVSLGQSLKRWTIAASLPTSTSRGSSFLSSRQLAELNLRTNVGAGSSSAPRNFQRFGVSQKALCATGVVRRSVLSYVKLGGRIKYDLADVERYVRANKRMPSVRA